jgi:hypothetical protein
MDAWGQNNRTNGRAKTVPILIYYDLLLLLLILNLIFFLVSSFLSSRLQFIKGGVFWRIIYLMRVELQFKPGKHQENVLLYPV